MYVFVDKHRAEELKIDLETAPRTPLALSRFLANSGLTPVSDYRAFMSHDLMYTHSDSVKEFEVIRKNPEYQLLVASGN